MFILNKFYCVIAVVLLFAACQEAEKEKPTIDWNKEKSTELNKQLVLDEKIDIKLFLAQHSDWKMKETGSGLQYYIYEDGVGVLAKAGQTAEVEYEISLLDGTICNKTASDEVELFKIDRAEIETGIQEGVKLLRKGAKAKFIIPSHLAHGLVGDLDKVPPLTTLVVDFHLRDLK